MLSPSNITRVHLITGGFPPGSPAGHDMDYARLRLLQLLKEFPHMRSYRCQRLYGHHHVVARQPTVDDVRCWAVSQ